MKTKNLTLLIALAAAATYGTLNLNAAEPALSPKSKPNQITTAQPATADPNLHARRPEVAASLKVLASFPLLGKPQKARSEKPMMACTCCKP